jgi:hypothetical protein
MMTARPRILLALTFVLLTALPGCALWRSLFGGNGPDDSRGELSAPEAQRALANARKLLYARQPPDADKAVELAAGVIENCDDPWSVWDAHQVKAEALQAQGKREDASRVAEAGMQALLAGTGRPTARALGLVRTLMVAYLENAVTTLGPEPALKQLKTWSADLEQRLGSGPAANRDEAEQMAAFCSRLNAMVEEFAGTQKPETHVQEVVKAYVRLFDLGDASGLAELLADGTALRRAVMKDGMAALGAKAVSELRIISAVRVAISEAKAVAHCDMLVISPDGWASEVKGAAFTLARQSDGKWRIRDINGLPGSGG